MTKEMLRLNCEDDLQVADHRDLENRQTFFEKKLEEVKSALKQKQ